MLVFAVAYGLALCLSLGYGTALAYGLAYGLGLRCSRVPFLSPRRIAAQDYNPAHYRLARIEVTSKHGQWAWVLGFTVNAHTQGLRPGKVQPDRP